MYRALEPFNDMQDNYFHYNPGDVFPRNGLEVPKERLEELSTSANCRGRAVIEFVNEDPVKGNVKEENAVYFPEEPKKAEIPDDFMNKPEIPDNEENEYAPVIEKPKRGRRKKVNVK